MTGRHTESTPRKRQQGQALTEFLLVFPLFLILLLGTMQLAQIAMAQQVVHYAAFAATRAAIVRPCMTFHPNFEEEEHFTPTVFSAAVLSTLAIAPSQNLGLSLPYRWLPVLPETEDVEGLGIGGGNSMDAALNMYDNAAYLTAVARVRPQDLDAEPPTWRAYAINEGVGFDCLNENNGGERRPRQNVPPPGFDLTLDVTFLYPMRIPLVNRIFFGAFVNFSSIARDMGLEEIGDDLGEYKKDYVMKYPTHTVLPHDQFEPDAKMETLLQYREFGFSSVSRDEGLGQIFFNDDRHWYPIPVRARCTLQVEGALHPLVTFDYDGDGDVDDDDR